MPLIHPQQLTLGQLINLLHPIATSEPDRPVRFDFCRFEPYDFSSYRGYYEDLAIRPSENGMKTVGEFWTKLLACTGETFTGWKGGDYVATPDTALWVSDLGEAHNTAIIGLLDRDEAAIIQTAYA